MDDEHKGQNSESEAKTEKEESDSSKDTSPGSAKKIPIGLSHLQRFKNWYKTDKAKSIPLTILVLILLIAAIPWTRYKAAGLVVKKNFSIVVLDADSHSPVSGAELSEGSLSTQTDGNGKAVLHLSAGHHTLLISKKYYQDRKADVLVPIFSQKSSPSLALTATGRQVKIVVKNLITQNNLAGVDITVADTSAKTDKNGVAIVVLPAGVSSQKANLSLDGYNDSDVTVKVSDSKVAENDFNLTPSGKIYFLSRRTGRLDLMKANLDGSGAQLAVAGTGNEQDYNTALLPSPDWKYAALVSKRNPTDPTPQLYMISAADDKLLSADSGNATFTLKGWAGDSLIYYVTRGDIQPWQAGKDKLKSYDATSGKTTLLDQTSATGDASASAYEYYALVTVSGNNVVYAKNWTQVYYSSPPGLLVGKQNSLSIIGADGQNHKLVANYDAGSNVQYAQHSPNAIYIWQQINSSDKFFDYSFGLAAPRVVNITSDQFYQAYPTYYSSPSGKQTFWAENRDGKNTLFLGDSSGSNPSTVATLSDYSPYGWFSDNYLLVTKGGSELLIMGAKAGQTVKITDYQPTGYHGY